MASAIVGLALGFILIGARRSSGCKLSFYNFCGGPQSGNYLALAIECTNYPDTRGRWICRADGCITVVRNPLDWSGVSLGNSADHGGLGVLDVGIELGPDRQFVGTWCIRSIQECP